MEDKKPKVSFIIPTMNSERTIEQNLRSIREQEYQNIEIIVVDGGSRDSTIEIARKYADKIIIVKGTLGKAREEGARISSGEILGIFDSDIYLPHKKWLENAVEKLLSRKRAGILWPVNVPPKKSSPVAKSYFALWEYRLRTTTHPIPGGNILVLRKAYVEAGGINTNLHFGEDYDLTLKILRLGYTYIIYPDPIIHDTMYSLKQYTRKQFWGARALREAPHSIVSATVSWGNYNENPIVSGIKHLWSFIASIPLGIKKYRDASILVVSPIMMTIRGIIYGIYARKIIKG